MNTNGLRGAIALSTLVVGLGVATGASAQNTGAPRQSSSVITGTGSVGNASGAMVQPGEGEYLLPARTVIQGMLVTGISSDLPGVIIGQITRDVYDRTQTVLLIPRGSFVTGTYDEGVVVGQNRLAMAWTLLELPNGERYPLPGLSATDREGLSGVRGKVNNHLSRVIGATLLSSVISYGAAHAMSEQQLGYGSQPSPKDQAIGDAVGNIQGVADRIAQRDLQIRPTIRIAQGQQFSVIVGRDLILPPYESRP